jgi:transposase
VVGAEKLFEMPEECQARSAEPTPRGVPRVDRADRGQMLMLSACPDELVESDHPVRGVWDFVARLELAALYAKVDSVEGGAGRPAIDPKILLTLWLYATLEGIGSARALADMCKTDMRFMWICGGVGVNHHSLSDFRTEHQRELDELLTKSAAMLMNAGMVDMKRVAQDGMRGRASAGAGSFRSGKRLKQFLSQAREQVQTLKQQLEDDPASESRQRQAAKERATKERLEKVTNAMRELEEIEAANPPREGEKCKRASTTDPEARVMKMADGGYRPAYNVQLATDTKTQVILGVAVTNVGSDMSQMEPMVEQLHKRYDKKPDELLVDGGFAKKEAIEAVSQQEITVYAPVQKPKDASRDPHERRKGDSAEIAAWRERMGTEDAQKIYKERSSTAECANAQMRNRGMNQFNVRGSGKVLSVAILFALAHNVVRAIALGFLG